MSSLRLQLNAAVLILISAALPPYGWLTAKRGSREGGSRKMVKLRSPVDKVSRALCLLAAAPWRYP